MASPSTWAEEHQEAVEHQEAAEHREVADPVAAVRADFRPEV